MRALLLCLSLLIALPAFAVQPDEILSDPALEARAREISKILRCPVCQGETIDDSNAPISRDLRLYLRERLVAGDTDQQAVTAITDRFGEFVLFEPPAKGLNWILWLAGPVMAVLALLIGWRFLRSRNATEATPEALSRAESERLKEIMRD
ncbi:cytochrome c-type biogenesis protein [Paracoccus aminophilus]|nr:cytochrome c-type biogenesis protein [Paracoccus aminophilus]